MGTSIGRNTMHSLDIDGDGKIEIVCGGSNTTYGLDNYWYIMRYNKADSTCNQIWTSLQSEVKITCIEVIDFNNDKNYTIVVGYENGTLEFYDAKTRNLLKSVSNLGKSRWSSSGAQINSFVYDDANNDGKKDIVFASDDSVFIYEYPSFKKQLTIIGGAKYLRVGNIDADSNNEIVLSSGVSYKVNGNTVTSSWNFYSNSYSTSGKVQLSDIDKDGMREIIFTGGTNLISVFDADKQTTKYTITIDYDVDIIQMIDVSGDGVDDILYGDGQWGDVVCYNSVTQQKLWSVNNPEHGVSAINYIDLDGDGKKELMWSAGWTSSGADYLYIYDVSADQLLWRSADICGPYYAIATGDVDADGADEIVAVSYESESGYAGGIIHIFDAKTHILKWKCSSKLMTSVWTGMYNVTIANVDDDAQNEIILSAGETYTGQTWIVDGKNHTVKSSHIFRTENLSEFYGQGVADVDGDGKQEIIATNSAKLFVINPADWTIKWFVSITTSNYSVYNQKPIVRFLDITNDGKPEILVCAGTLQIIDPADHSVWNSPNGNYIGMDIYDINQDKTNDIILSTTNGHIVAMNGATKTIISDVHPENTNITAVKMLLYQNRNVYVYTCESRVNAYFDDSTCVVSKYLGENTGLNSSLQIFKSAKDTTILVGTSVSVLELSIKQIQCLSFDTQIEKTEVSCSKNDGKILVKPIGGKAPYTFTWSDKSTRDSLVNLAIGTYTVTALDNAGCQRIKNITVPQASISVDWQSINEGCKTKGSILATVYHINAPYTVKWSNNVTTIDNKNISIGNYSVSVTDSKSCKTEKSFTINKDTIIISSYSRNVSCGGYNDGSIMVSTLTGAYPFSYSWSTGQYGNSLYYLHSGTYTVTVSDAVGCTSAKSFTINEPQKITYNVLTNPDNANTLMWDGKAMINNISGGLAPYTVTWPRLSKTGEYIEALPAGNYAFIISDYNGCSVGDTAIISSFTDNAEIETSWHVSALHNSILISNDQNETLQVEVISMYGQIIATTTIGQTTSIPLANSATTYLVKVWNNKQSSITKITINQ